MGLKTSFNGEWEVKTLGDIADCLDSIRVPLNETQRSQMKGDYPYCGANGVLDHVNGYVIDDDIILMAEDGGYFDEYETRPIAYRMKGKCWVNNHAHILKAKRGYDQGFLYYSLVHKNILPFLASGTRAKLNKSEMIKIQIRAPADKAEQTSIATALSHVDALIAKLDQLIAKKRDLKKAATQELLTGRTRLPGFSGEWEVKRLDTLAVIDPESLSSATDPAFAFNYISLDDVDKGTLRGYREQTFGTAPSRARRVLKRSDIMISTVRPNLQSHLLFDLCGGDWVCSTGFSVVRCLPKVAHPGFVYQHMFADGASKQIDAMIAGSNYPAINSTDVRRLTIPAPGYEEQTAISTALSDMDAEISALEARREKTRTIKQGMMQVLLTGQVRLPVSTEQKEALA